MIPVFLLKGTQLRPIAVHHVQAGNPEGEPLGKSSGRGRSHEESITAIYRLLTVFFRAPQHPAAPFDTFQKNLVSF